MRAGAEEGERREGEQGVERKQGVDTRPRECMKESRMVVRRWEKGRSVSYARERLKEEGRGRDRDERDKAGLFFLAILYELARRRKGGLGDNVPDELHDDETRTR
jgi:hypothetical protein